MIEPVPSSPDADHLFVPDGKKVLLHVGCGGADMASAGPGFHPGHWREIRLDIDPGAQPDILGSMVDMSAVPEASVDAVFSSHSLEHLFAHEIPVALGEMHRSLKATGFALVTVPDLQSIAELIVADRLLDVAYESPAGPIAAIDMVYGLRSALTDDPPYMAHRYGFTLSTLVQELKQAGFASVVGVRRAPAFDLWALATVSHSSEASLRQLAMEFIPGGPGD